MILPCISLDHEAMPKHGICPSGALGRQAGLAAGAGLEAFATRQASAKERTTGGMTAGRQPQALRRHKLAKIRQTSRPRHTGATPQNTGARLMKEFAFLVLGMAIGGVIATKAAESKKLERELDRERSRKTP